MSKDFYRAFEDQHRGSREMIQSRLAVYLPFVRALARMHPDAPVLDLGCGRGEWLELLRDTGIASHGVDLDEGMLAACRERGLDARRGDAIEYLAQLPDASQGVVSAFHVAEHLPMAALDALVGNALRVLRPGGLLILETPNAENLVVGAVNFYTDPTHLRPLPPALLSFLPVSHGFERVKLLRLQESPRLRGDLPLSLIDVLAGVSPDYAVIAQKPSPSTAPDAELETAFARDYGVSLNTLADKYEDQWQARVSESRVAAEDARSAERRTAAAERRAASAEHRAALAEQHAAITERHAATAEQHAATAEQHARRTEERAAAIEARMDEALGLQREVVRIQGEIQAIFESRSWRLTRPLRWLTEQRLALREEGIAKRLRHLGRRLTGAQE